MKFSSVTGSRIGRTAVGVIAIGIVGVSLAAPAFARAPDGDSTDDHESDCWFLQQQYDQAMAANLAAKPGSKAESDSLDQAIAAVHAWQSDGCQGDYGDIEEARPAPPNPRVQVQGLRHSPTVSQSSTGAAQVKGLGR